MLHLSDDGALQASMSTSDFFAATNQSRLSELKDAIKAEKESYEMNNEAQENDSELLKKKGIIQDEEKEDSMKVDYGACIDYFNFCTEKLGGKFSVFVVLGLHILINIATSSMSFYLAFALSNLGQTDTTSETRHE